MLLDIVQIAPLLPHLRCELIRAIRTRTDSQTERIRANPIRIRTTPNANPSTQDSYELLWRYQSLASIRYHEQYQRIELVV